MSGLGIALMILALVMWILAAILYRTKKYAEQDVPGYQGSQARVLLVQLLTFGAVLPLALGFVLAFLV